jgi:hypothetical protein
MIYARIRILVYGISIYPIRFPGFRSRSDRDEFSPAFQGREYAKKAISVALATVDLKHFLSIVDSLRSGVADATQFFGKTVNPGLERPG